MIFNRAGPIGEWKCKQKALLVLGGRAKAAPIREEKDNAYTNTTLSPSVGHPKKHHPFSQTPNMHSNP